MASYSHNKDTQRLLKAATKKVARLRAKGWSKLNFANALKKMLSAPSASVPLKEETLCRATDWIDCYKKLPPENSRVRVFYRGQEVEATFRCLATGQYWEDSSKKGESLIWDYVSHWKPLPKKEDPCKIKRRHALKWISCKERLPASEEEVLILVHGKCRVGSLALQKSRWISPDSDYCWEQTSVTHWSKLPPTHERAKK